MRTDWDSSIVHAWPEFQSRQEHKDSFKCCADSLSVCLTPVSCIRTHNNDHVHDKDPVVNVRENNSRHTLNRHTTTETRVAYDTWYLTCNKYKVHIHSTKE